VSPAGAKSSLIFATDTALPSIKSVFVGGYVGTRSLKKRMTKV